MDRGELISDKLPDQLLKTGNYNSLIDHFLTSLAVRFRSDKAYIFGHRMDEKRLVLVSSHGAVVHSAEECFIDLTESSIAAESYYSVKSTYIEKVTGCDQICSPITAQIVEKDLFIYPLVFLSRPIGLLLLGDLKDRLAVKDIDDLNQATFLISLVLDNLQLSAERQKKHSSLLAVINTSNMVLQVNDDKEICSKVLIQLTDVTSAVASVALVFNESTNSVRVITAKNMHETLFTGKKEVFSDVGLMDELSAKGVMVIQDDGVSMFAEPWASICKLTSCKTFFGYSFQMDDHIHYQFLLFFKEKKYFASVDKDLVVGIGSQAKIAMQNSERYKELQSLSSESSKTKDMFKLLLDHVSEGVILIDKDFKIFSANRAFYEIFKIKSSKVIGKTCHDVVSALPRVCDDCPVAEVFDQGNECSVKKFKHSLPDNSSLEHSMHAYPVRDLNGVVVQAIVVFSV